MTDELFFDTDCLSAFLWINDTNILHELFMVGELFCRNLFIRNCRIQASLI